MAKNRQRVSREWAALCKRRARFQRSRERRNLRCMSDIKKRARNGRYTIWTLTRKQEAAWDLWNLKRRAA